MWNDNMLFAVKEKEKPYIHKEDQHIYQDLSNTICYSLA